MLNQTFLDDSFLSKSDIRAKTQKHQNILPMSRNIVIIGAGPSGLVLASLFHCHQIPFNIYDLRPHPSPSLVNIPSGSLDLHPESGQLAQSECGLLEEFRSITVECSEEHIICDRYGDIEFKDSGHGGGRPGISRNSLIELIL